MKSKTKQRPMPNCTANCSAEIARLTAEVERLTEWHREHGITLVALAAANERAEKLEKALREWAMDQDGLGILEK